MIQCDAGLSRMRKADTEMRGIRARIGYDIIVISHTV